MKKFTLLLSLLFAIISIQAQDYLINFAGTGASTTVGTVTVENLTKGTSLSLNGSEVLHLSVTYTGINPLLESKDALRIYPNPTTGNSTIEFVATASGGANVELYDITGKRLSAAKNTLTIGTHSYQISGLRSGIYTVKIYSQAYTYTGKLVSNGAPNSNVKISYVGNSMVPVTAKTLKSASTEKTMQYNNGDLLKFTGNSDNYITIVTDKPTQSKILIFNFVDCTDADGNNYPVVQIGTQVWMAENLKTTKYSNGNQISTYFYSLEWKQLTTGAYCFFNNEIKNKATYGLLYNGHAVNTGNLNPTGWHVPSQSEWKTLIDYLGKERLAGGKLKENRTTHWQSPNEGATNETGFTALPGGYRSEDGEFYDVNKWGSWWSATINSASGIGLSYSASFDSSAMESYSDPLIFGSSVRCLKDDFTSSAVVPTLSTIAVSNLATTTASAGGNVMFDGSAKITARGVCWNTTGNPTIANSKTTDGIGKGSFTSSITSLQPNTTYFLRAYAINSQGVAYGEEIKFKTLTGTITDVDGNVYYTITIGTQIWMAENLKSTKYRNGDPVPNVTDNSQWSNLRTGAYCDYDNRSAYSETYGKLYNWHAVYDSRNIAPNGWHIPTEAEWTRLINFLGNENIGGKLKEIGTIHWKSSNTGATNEMGFTALPGGKRSNYGIFTSIENDGFWWTATEQSIPNAYKQKMTTLDNSLVLDNDFKESGYSIRCVSDIALKAVLPEINTKVSLGYGSTTTQSGGKITSDGGANVTARGVCWNTSQNPTIENFKTSDGTGVGIFKSDVKGLTPNTTYYLRAYATNSVGTSYGKEEKFTTPLPVSDIEGNVYQTVTIGNQVWMAENLKTTKYNDGTSIPNFAYTETPGYADNSIYGAYYNWYAVSTGKLCPFGWHVPTDAEWSILVTYLGGESVAGIKLKETGTTHWNYYPGATSGTNESGFSALPGGNKDRSDNYSGRFGFWWSSGEGDAWVRKMSYSSNDVIRNNGSKSSGLSVRCIKDPYTFYTSAASSITTSSAVCGGIIFDDGSAFTERGLCYSTNKNPTTSTNKIAVGSGTGAFSKTITGLSPNTTYYVRSYAINSVGTAYGNEISFRTYTAGSETITDIDGNVYHTVTIGTQVWTVENLKTTKLNDGTNIPNVTGIDAWYIKTPGYCWYNDDVSNKNNYGALYNWYTLNTKKLAPIGWHVASDAEWKTLTTFLGGGDVAGNKLKETGTSHWQSPNDGATNETGFTALPGGYGSNDGTYSSVGYIGKWVSSNEFITYSTQYGELKRDSSTYWGWDNVRFSVRCVKGDFPIINTTAASNITSSSATLGGNVSNDWGALVTARGVCWNTTGNPTLADNKTTDGTGTGSFISNLTNLTGSNTYYIRAYATNSVGTAYGNEITITTPDLATVTTSAITGITSTSSICGGNVTNDGGATVTERGVCYSTSKNPTISNSKMNIGSGKGTFTKTITSLAPSTTYYIRAYATNSVGTGYGNELILKTFTGTVTDIDGNVYNTVTIGTQVWMVENLKTTHYRNGSPISYITQNSTWAFMETGAYCNYNNNSNNAITYGKLYNWYAVSDTRNIAPTGWHVPNNAEWKTLTDYLINNGSVGSDGNIAKSMASTSGWTSSTIAGNVGNNQASNNGSGFAGLPGGIRNLEYWNDENAFFHISNYGYWWSSSSVYSFSLSYNESSITKSYSDKEFGYSVRCIKD